MVTKVINLEDKLSKSMLKDHETTKRLIDHGDKRVLYVKLADRMHNMRTIAGHSSMQKRQQIASETLQFFVPVAKELGLFDVAQELEDRSLAVLGKNSTHL